MKKIIFALSGLFFLSLGSCQKEEITPNRNHVSMDKELINGNCPNKSGGKGEIFIIVYSDSLDNITDPNRDEDDERRAKRK